MKPKQLFVVKRILPVLAGGLLGYAYYYFIGCQSGTCPIQSSPWISTAYGGLMGLVLAFPGKKKSQGKAAGGENGNENG